MKRLYFILLSFAFIISVFSCKKSEIEDGYGYLSVNLDEDDTEEIVFKSSPEADQIFSITVYNSLQQKVAFVEDYRTLGNEGIVLPAGNFEYTALASSGDDKSAAFGEPFYSGTKKFTIETGKTTSIDIVCSLANVKVTADFSEISQYFKSYELTVSNGLDELVFSNVSDPVTVDNEGFFSVTDMLTWSLRLVNNDNVPYKELTGTCKDIKANRHYIFKFSLDNPDSIDGAGAITVTIDDTMTEQSIDLDLNFGDTTIPEITTDFGYDGTNPVSIMAGDATSRAVTLSSEDGFKSIILSYGTNETSTKTSDVSYELVDAGNDILSALAADGISVASVAYGAKSCVLTLTDYIKNLAMGSYDFNLFMVDINDAFTKSTITFDILSDVDVEAMSVNPWARFAAVEAKWYPATQPNGISFQYKKASDSSWTDFDGNVSVNSASRTYSAEIRGLEPSTDYVFRAISAEDKETKEISFITEKEETLHNMSFDYWWMDGKAPMPNQSSEYHIWDSANPGSADVMGLSYIPTNPESEHTVSGAGKAAKLETLSVPVVGLAAGNLYTGKFISTVGGIIPSGAALEWGVEFAARPLALKGFYDYRPAIIDVDKLGNLKGQSDICQIQVILTDWDAPFNVNTSEGKFVDLEDEHIIAYGSYEDSRTMSDYEDFTIKLEYRDKMRTPKYIVIVASASKYGDYFTGGVGSTLYLDEFEFVYDPDQLD